MYVHVNELVFVFIKILCCGNEILMCGDDKFDCRQFTFLSKFKMCRSVERLWIQNGGKKKLNTKMVVWQNPYHQSAKNRFMFFCIRFVDVFEMFLGTGSDQFEDISSRILLVFG